MPEMSPITLAILAGGATSTFQLLGYFLYLTLRARRPKPTEGRLYVPPEWKQHLETGRSTTCHPITDEQIQRERTYLYEYYGPENKSPILIGFDHGVAFCCRNLKCPCFCGCHTGTTTMDDGQKGGSP